VSKVRLALNQPCSFLRTTTAVDDMKLLRDIAEAFRHFKLDLDNRRNAIIMLGSGWEQVLVLHKTRRKA
jgi:hypothetical protein